MIRQLLKYKSVSRTESVHQVAKIEVLIGFIWLNRFISSQMHFLLSCPSAVFKLDLTHFQAYTGHCFTFIVLFGICSICHPRPPLAINYT